MILSWNLGLNNFQILIPSVQLIKQLQGLSEFQILGIRNTFLPFAQRTPLACIELTEMYFDPSNIYFLEK